MTRTGWTGVLLLVAGIGLAAWLWPAAPVTEPAPSARVDAAAKRAVLRGYRRLAHYSYEAAYHSAGQLRSRIAELLATPSATTLQAARASWRAARVDYSQTEVFRFGNWIVDDWEGGVNAWPVDEGLLDYVQAGYAASPTNPLARQNLVARAKLEIAGIPLDTRSLDWRQLKFIHGGSENETNVALGYHAIEFLLWGQDLQLDRAGAGQRPWTDFATTAPACSSGPARAPVAHCQRRRQLLRTLADHLYSELGSMTLNWAGNSPTSYGLHIAEGDVDEGLRRLLFGMLALGGDEMAGERLQVALLTGAPEEEQDCFSDDTHNSAWFNFVGIRNIYQGRYQKPGYRDGLPYDAPLSLAALARRADADLAARLDAAFARTAQRLAAIRAAAAAGQPFDLLIRPDNRQGQQLIEAAIAALTAQSALLEELGAALGLGRLNPQAPPV